MRHVSIIWEGNKSVQPPSEAGSNPPAIGCDLPVSKSCAHYSWKKRHVKNNDSSWPSVCQLLQYQQRTRAKKEVHIRAGPALKQLMGPSTTQNAQGTWKEHDFRRRDLAWNKASRWRPPSSHFPVLLRIHLQWDCAERREGLEQRGQKRISAVGDE